MAGALVMVAMAATYVAAPAAMRVDVDVDHPVQPGPNLIANGGFEDVEGGQPVGWQWSPRNTDATFALVEPGRRGGKCVRIRNTTPLSPHVYGQLVLSEPVPLAPGETYVLSGYSQSIDPGPAWVGGGDGWWMRIPLAGTAGRWRRFSRTFVAREGDVRFALMINTDGPTEGFLVDDVKLELGSTPTPVVRDDADTSLTADLDFESPVDVPGDEWSFSVLLSAPSAAPDCVVRCEARDEGGTLIAVGESPADLRAGVTAAHVTCPLAGMANVTGMLSVSLTAGDGRSASDEAPVAVYTRAGFRERFARVAPAVEALRAAVTRARNAGRNVAYPIAALQVADRFGPVVEATADAGNVRLAQVYSDDLVRICETATRQVAGIEQGAPDPSVPDPPMGRLRIRGRNLEADGVVVNLVGPLGYGELYDELDTVRNYGFNVVGDDFDAFASLSMVTGPDTIDETAVPRLRANWDRLHALNLAISFNPTLHYFPEWAITRYPDITGGDPVDRVPDWSGLGQDRGQRTKVYGGFFPFAIESPTVKHLVERYYAALLPGIRDHESFHLYWLMNEPTYRSDDPEYRSAYHRFLREKYGEVSALNERWGTGFESFDAIPPAREPADPGRYDFMTFHRAHVADWFTMLATEVRRHDPAAILSNKPMAWTIMQPDDGIDFERQAEILDIPGCDAGRSPGSSEYAFAWDGATFLFDFYSSVAPDKPQADLEYHYVHEPEVAAEYVRASYWQSYLHGLRVSTFWVWARGQLGSGEAGAGMTHTAWSQPNVGWGTASAALDLRRLSWAIAQFPPPAEVALYFCTPSLYLGGGEYQAAMSNAYRGLFFLDAPVGFVTDKMLAEGRADGLKVVVLPACRWVERESLDRLRALAARGVRLVTLGDGPTFDEYRHPHPAGSLLPADEVTSVRPGPPGDIRRQMAPILDRAQVRRPIRCFRADGETPEAVECRSVVHGDGVLCSLLNLGKAPVRIRLEHHGETVRSWKDLISDRESDSGWMELRPSDPRLLWIAADRT
ncbi:MAG TPA: beta-galactosidase [Armatimonadota bacterium]|nr:beta-galactosidase [Armatimonadota bacterium]